jgi:hypothetical protein
MNGGIAHYEDLVVLKKTASIKDVPKIRKASIAIVSPNRVDNWIGFCWVSSDDIHPIVGIAKVPTHWNVINVSSEWVSMHLVGRCVRIHYVCFHPNHCTLCAQREHQASAGTQCIGQ